MGILKKAVKQPHIYAVQSQRSTNREMNYFDADSISQGRLYEQLRIQVPVIDACISKIIRLTGNFKLKCLDERYQ